MDDLCLQIKPFKKCYFTSFMPIKAIVKQRIEAEESKCIVNDKNPVFLTDKQPTTVMEIKKLRLLNSKKLIN